MFNTLFNVPALALVWLLKVRIKKLISMPDANTSPQGRGIFTMKKGYKSPINGHLGVYTHCSGPDPKGPVPGERIIIVIYNNEDKIVRTLEQVRGNCIDPGWVDFFNSMQCRPSVHEYLIIDTDENGNKTTLAKHTSTYDAHDWFARNCPVWVQQHGIPENA